VATSYDDQRFTSLLGRFFNHLSCQAIRRAFRAISDERLACVLDIPCGTGRATVVAREFGSTVLGADISAAMIGQARHRPGLENGVPFICANISHQPFATSSIDCVMAIRLMMHLDAAGRQAALREMARVSREYAIVEYGYISPWLRIRRSLKATYYRLLRKRHTFVQAIQWTQIKVDLQKANVELVATYHTARGLSESVVLLLRK
jgi:SAM-dependent methyltransferase